VSSANYAEVTEIVYFPGVLPYWKVVWEEDLRAPSRHLISKIFYLAATGLLHLCALGLKPVLDLWLNQIIHEVFNGLSLIALGVLAIPMAVEMLRAGYKSVLKP
jgi:hypothetical protein